jgi:hypothetical protein
VPSLFEPLNLLALVGLGARAAVADRAA